jgi:hypothetical protein
MRRVTVVIAAAAVLLGACGDAGLLDGMGERVQDAVVGETSIPTTVVAETGTGPVLRFVPAAELVWWNDNIPEQEVGEPDFTRAKVWNRGRTRVIQASRAEIAAVLPGVRFPRIIAEDIGFVTSQLLFDVASSQIDPGTSAQFGLWAGEPYTPEQSAIAVLRVGRPNEGSEITDIIPEVVQEGVSLIWIDGEFRYEFFCQTGLLEDYCWEMAESVVPLRLLVPEVEPETT